MNKILHEMELLEMELVGLNIEFKKAAYERDIAWKRLHGLKCYYSNHELCEVNHELLDKHTKVLENCRERVGYLRRRRDLIRERLALLTIRYNEENFGMFYKSEIDDLCYLMFW